MSGNAEMRCPLPRFDPRCHQIDRIGGSMRRKCGEIIGLRQTFEISAGRKDDRHLAAIGHGEGRLRARPENKAMLGGLDRELVAIRRRRSSIESGIDGADFLEVRTPARKWRSEEQTSELQ